ncbi:MAG: sugar transferase [Solobacterium sp.]|nr:sugar transferase [Solobacterium sp.]HAE15012.1 UDP-galactose phosphate transferase [Erysipelotrichaceae bacterium]
MYDRVIKRILDIIISLAVILVLSPVYLITALLVRVKLGSPVLFSQLRPGYHEKIFRMYKFRSMTDERDENGKLLPDEVRLTPFGAKLRSTSLDELPEMFNILKGDMSIVGPRPQLVRDIVFMTEEQRHRADVRPGLTGLAQINGRNAISWKKKLEYDLEYIRNESFLYDLKIFFGTFAAVFRHDDINMEGEATALDMGDWLLKEGKVTEEEYLKKQEEAKELIRRSGL